MSEDSFDVAAYYEKNFYMLVKKLSRRAGSIENAEDVVQSAFERAIRYMDSYDPSRSFDLWFNRILVGCMADLKREEKLQGMSGTELEETLDGDKDEMYVRAVLDQAQDIINSMGKEDAEILTLYFPLNYTLLDVRRVTGKSLSECKYAIKRFNDKLAEVM